MTDPTKTTPDPLAFLAPGWARATVVQPNRSPWLQAPPQRPHVARTVFLYSPAILRAADAKP